MTNRLVVASILLLIILPIASAATVINLKTVKYHDVGIYVLDAEATYQLIESFQQESDGQGKVSVTTTTTEPVVDILVIVKWNGQTTFSKRFQDIPTNNEIKLFLPENFADTENTTQTPPENSTNQTTEAPLNETNSTITENNTITGLVASDTQEDGSFSPILWIVLAVVAIAVALLFAMKKNLFKRTPSNPYETKEYKFTKQKDSGQKETIKINSSSHNMEKQLMSAEKKLQEAQLEINKLKNNKKIEEAERKLDEDRAKLQRLKAGYDS